MRRALLVVCVLGAGLGVAMFCSLEPTVPSAVQAARPAEEFKNYREKIPGSEVSFDMIAIKGGVFLMGSPDGEKDRQADEGPQHPVELRSFWMGKTEVTWDEFEQYWRPGELDKPIKEGATGADAMSRPTKTYVDAYYGHGREGHPAICMTQHAAMEYCRWLSLKTGKLYRLPTEAEWEYACRAGTKTAYSFGDDPNMLGDYAWYEKNAEDLTHPVGKKKPNPWGLHDMYGNVYEWCLDHYQKDSYAKFPKDKPTVGPVQLPTAKRFSHVTRGGSWSDKPDQCRSAARLGSTEEWIKHDPQQPKSIWWLTKWDVVGFRVVRPLEEYDNLKGLKSKITKESE